MIYFASLPSGSCVSNEKFGDDDKGLFHFEYFCGSETSCNIE